MLFAPFVLALCPTGASLQDPEPPPSAEGPRVDAPAPQSAFAGAGLVLAAAERLVGKGNVSGAFWRPRPPETAPAEVEQQRPIVDAKIVVDRVDAVYLPGRGGARGDGVRVDLELVVQARDVVQATDAFEELLLRLEASPAFVRQERKGTRELETGRGVRGALSVQLDLSPWTERIEAGPDSAAGQLSQTLVRRIAAHPDRPVGPLDITIGERTPSANVLERFAILRPARRQGAARPATTPPAFAAALEDEGLVVTAFLLKPKGREAGRDWDTSVTVARRSIMSPAASALLAPQSAFAGTRWLLALLGDVVGSSNVSGAVWSPGPPEASTEGAEELCWPVPARVEVTHIAAETVATEERAEVVQIELGLDVSADRAGAAGATLDALRERLQRCPAFVSMDVPIVQEDAAGKTLRCALRVVLDLSSWTGPVVPAEPAGITGVQAFARSCATHDAVRLGALACSSRERTPRPGLVDSIVRVRLQDDAPLEAFQAFHFATLVESDGLAMISFVLKPAELAGADQRFIAEFSVSRRAARD